MLVIDDVHWADQASTRLLRFVAQSIAESPVLVVHLTGLPASDVSRLMELTCGQAPDAAGTTVPLAIAHVSGAGAGTTGPAA